MKWLMKQLGKWLAVAVVLAGLAIVAYAVIGDFGPPQSEQTIPVTIDVN